MLIMKADAAYPGKFDFRYNLEKVLQETVPAGKGWYAENQAEKPIEGGENALWRKGSFEVMNMNTGEVLYSKLVRSGWGSGRGKRRTHKRRTHILAPSCACQVAPIVNHFISNRKKKKKTGG